MLKNNNPLESKFFLIRLKLLYSCLSLVLIVIVLRLFVITVINGNMNLDKSENNFMRSLQIEPVRGIICDRNNIPLAVNRHNYSINITKFRIPFNTVLSTIRHVSEITGKKINVDVKRLKATAHWKPVKLLSGLSFDEITPIYERLHQLPGISIIDNYERYYPYGEIVSNFLGYVNKISKTEYDTLKEQGYLRNSLIGKTGIEKEYETLLHGKMGTETVVYDAKGRRMDSIESDSPVPGENITLSIDLDLQRYAVETLGTLRGAIIAADPVTGEILAMACYPTFDPNDLAKPGNSFVNMVIKGHYSPGSTFKAVTAIAGLNEGISPFFEVSCDSYYHFSGNTVFRCDQKSGHGSLNLRESLKYSCNIYFYTIANRVGGEKMLKMAWQLGFGSKSGVDIPNEGNGVLPPPSKKSLFPGEVVILGIGQGKISTTPIQVLNLYCALANGGKLITPHLFKSIDENHKPTEEVQNSLAEIKTRISKKIDTGIEKKYIDIVREGYYKVVHEEGGTGYRVGFKPEWDVAGKTGTAQNWRGDVPDAWFACWSPYENPEIVVTVVIENAGHGATVAGPIAKNIIGKYYEKKTGVKYDMVPVILPKEAVEAREKKQAATNNQAPAAATSQE